MRETISRPSRLPIIHAVVFSFGIVGTLIGIFGGNAQWFLAAGPCLILSAVLTWIGCRITFSGPTGDVLRAVIGPARVRGIHLRAIAWALAGLLVCLWGLQSLRQQDDASPLDDPMIGADV